MFAHLPLALSIAATGPAVVSLVEHATDQRSPAVTARLLSGSTPLGLLALVVIMRNLQDFERLHSLYRPVSASLIAASAAALAVGWIRPAPWLLALSLVLILAVVWALAVQRWLRLGDPAQALPGAEPSRP